MADGQYDVIVVGAGIAGASAAWHLAASRRVLLLEREAQPGYHATGRSAAIYSEAYGNAAVRAITTAGRAFFENPPAGFAAHPLLGPRGALFVGREDQRATLEAIVEETAALVEVRRLDGAGARAICPALQPDYVACAALEPGAMDIDVAALHQGFLRGLKSAGGTLLTDAGVDALERTGGGWTVATPAGRFAAPVVVNAAGAWCDVVGLMAGAARIGLVPKRRTAFLFDPPAGSAIAGWPLVIDADEQFYFKPDAGRLMGSPADETPVEPQDVQPEELDVAIAVERIQQAADLPIRRIAHRWAGLRSFVRDKTPVAGYDSAAEGFFWLAGQGGYGVQTSPAMGRIVAHLVETGEVPPDVRDLGVTAATLSPARLR